MKMMKKVAAVMAAVMVFTAGCGAEESGSRYGSGVQAFL